MPAAPLSRSEVIDNLFTTTWRNRKADVVDQIYTITPFYSMLLEKGRIRVEDTGGRFYDCPARFAKADGNLKFFDKGDTFSETDQEFLTELTYQMRYLGTNIVRFWRDDLQNRGRSKLLDYINQKLDNHKSAMIDKLETASFTADPSGKGIEDLQTLVSTTPTTGTVAGYNRATNSWIRNQARDFTALTISTDLLPEMTTIFNTQSTFKSGTRRAPDFIITTQALYEEYETLARNLHTIVANTSIQASLGFGDLSFKGVPIFWSPEAPSGNIYFLNLEHWHFVVDSFAWFDMTPWKPQTNSLDRQAQIVLTANMMLDNFQKQGVMFNVA